MAYGSGGGKKGFHGGTGKLAGSFPVEEGKGREGEEEGEVLLLGLPETKRIAVSA